jgi:hopanoid biosynthesis associated radical SAM protein HpnH
MAMPLHLTVKLGTYLMKQKIRRVEKYPLIMELEPLFACNLACAGCGKIQHPASVLKQRMPVEQAVAAVEECGAPMVSIAGGEPLMHPQIHVITEELLKRKKFVVLCTNAVLLPKHIDKFKPNKNFAWMVHLDGIGEKHDEAVSKVGVFDQAVTAIKLAKQKGFQVYTNTTVFNTETPQDLIDTLDYINDELGVDRLEIAPGYAYSKAPDQDRFLGVTQTRELFSQAFAEGRRKKWRFNHSQLYLDFLEGKADFQCTPWGVPLYCLKGWQKPCYLLDDGYAETWQELLDDTDWDNFGRGKDPRCDNCMAHCGYEPTAVLATMSSLKESLRAFAGYRRRPGPERGGGRWRPPPLTAARQAVRSPGCSARQPAASLLTARRPGPQAVHQEVQQPVRLVALAGLAGDGEDAEQAGGDVLGADVSA